MSDDVTVVSAGHHAEALGGTLNPHLSVIVNTQGDSVRFVVADAGEGPHIRVGMTLSYLRHLHGVARAHHGQALDAPRTFVFQSTDNPSDDASVSWEALADSAQVRLVPDLYYYQGRGYEQVLTDVPDWSGRTDRLVWRGSTTGGGLLTAGALDALPRYRLAVLARDLGSSADVGITSVVQAASATDEEAMTARLDAEGTLRSYMPIEDMRTCRYLVDIDGNSNSWNFIQRLKVGACMLVVESTWKQWFHDRLRPWEHFVPVRRDLTDFLDKVAWCREHEHQAGEIAGRGRRFALDMRFDEEMTKAARVSFLP